MGLLEQVFGEGVKFSKYGKPFETGFGALSLAAQEELHRVEHEAEKLLHRRDKGVVQTATPVAPAPVAPAPVAPAPVAPAPTDTTTEAAQ